ncbi:DEAD/DEAH box helicase [Segetibacter sp. 3557_3]|uniref:DEAD/DEAH box helicase n=1 Tax=Segetibacter sp. 3557_3 TaxID=2547429 RepID=UPI001058EA38|nr:DEAD/DEAH box helicase [Segetibacter sp. 3557_3]TDH27397.1 DEAD/DEAH box helicase [Segetibacter sp. 3557_3]
MKTAEKIEKKVALLLLPEHLNRGHEPIRSLHINRSPTGINYDVNELSTGELRNAFQHVSSPCKDALVRFTSDHLIVAEQDIKKKLASQKAGVSRELYMERSIIRHYNDLFCRLKPFLGSLKWYHRTSIAGKKYKTAPCTFSNFTCALHFEVVKDANRLVLNTLVLINGIAYPLSQFTRYRFLLESANEYFMLSFKDLQTLDWLEEVNPLQFAFNPTALSQHVLTRLEPDYPVNRNGHFPKKEVQLKPQHRVLLSELNNAFLMFTPQWVYDGFVVEAPWKPTYEIVVDGEEYMIVRDRDTEAAFVKELASFHPNFIQQRNGYFYLPFAEAQKKQWFLKSFHKMLEMGIELVGMDMLHHFRYSSFKPETSTRVIKEEGSRVELEMKVLFGKEELSLAVLQKMLLAGQKAVMLKDSSLGILGDEWLEQYAAIVKHGRIQKDRVSVTRFMAIAAESGSAESTVLKPLIKKLWWDKWKQWQEGGEPVYAVPETVHATLRPYQQKGFEWLTLLAEAGAGGCLADDMGLGKTLQTICFLAYHIHRNPTDINIIVSPSSLIYNWHQELHKFSPGITTVVYHGASRDKEVLKSGKQVIITSYGTLRSDVELLSGQEYGVAVIDESHNIKNPSAQITTAVNQLNAGSRIALSGTPVVNNTFDLYSQLNFSVPGMFGSREFFKKEYADAIDRYQDEDKITALRKLTAPFILRRTKEQVARDLPVKTEIVLWCNMSGRQKELYNDIKDQVRGNIFMNIKDNGLNKSKLAVLQGIMKLRQVCNSPLLLPANEQQGCTDSVKTEVLISELQNVLGKHKALVFSQFSSMLKLLAGECDRQGIAYYHFDGQTPPEKRLSMVNAFQEEDNATNLFLISLKAGNTGLTLTSADYVFLFDPWWNTAVEQQAIDRTHRIGQTKKVFAYKVVCKDTIEEKIIGLQQKKKKLSDQLVADDEGFMKSLDEDDIAYLFS